MELQNIDEKDYPLPQSYEEIMAMYPWLVGQLCLRLNHTFDLLDKCLPALDIMIIALTIAKSSQVGEIEKLRDEIKKTIKEHVGQSETDRPAKKQICQMAPRHWKITQDD